MIELALFGSIVRDDLRPESDIDVLITLGSNHSWGLEIVTMREELSALCKRSIDLHTRQSIEQSRNAIRRQEILESAEVIYVAEVEAIGYSNPANMIYFPQNVLRSS